MKNLKNRTMVAVLWIDSGAASREGWTRKRRHLKRFTPKVFTTPTITVGMVMGSDEKALYLAGAYSPTYKTWMDAQALYRPDIVEIIPLTPIEGSLRYKGPELVSDWIEKNDY